MRRGASGISIAFLAMAAHCGSSSDADVAGGMTAGGGGSNAQGGSDGAATGTGGSTGGGAIDAGGRAGSEEGGTVVPTSDGGAPDASQSGLDSEIAGAVSAIGVDRITSGIDTLAAFTTRNTCADNTSGGNALGAARDWIRAQLEGIPGLVVSLEDFTYGGCASGTVTNQNVIAVKLGAHPDRVFVIGGHYDSRTIRSTDPTGRAPGANDSGSQTAAVIDIARVLSPLQFDATLLFAAFSAEEQGFHGSAQLVKDYPKYVTPGAKVEAMIDLDIIGGDNVANDAMSLQHYRVFSPGTPREFNIPMGVTDDTSPSRGLMRFIGYWGGVYVPSMTIDPVLHEDRPGRGSDHESFINVGIPGVRFIETKESPNAATAQSHQHSANDLPQYVTPSYTAHIAQIVAAAGATLARAPMPPGTPMATGSSSGPVMLTWAAPSGGAAVDHYVIAARPTTENFYRTRVTVPGGGTSHAIAPADLGIPAGASFFISVAAADAAGHESLFAYPEYRCDDTSCAVQPGSLNVTARN
jgi:acetylornithine deacetylase/succinyl-diaminopimelate desuccinylase-like protein